MSTTGRNILVSYRRDDVRDLARRLSDALAARFPGRVFLDIQTIEPGTDFVEAITTAIRRAGVLIAVIGDDWSGRRSAGRSRLLDPHDFVRLEIASALRENLRVIPVLAPGAELPAPQDLPEDMGALLRLQALSLTDAHLHADVERLVELVATHLGEQREKVALIGMPGNSEWTVTIQVLDSDVREIFLRVGAKGELRSTGFQLARNQRTGLPLPRMDFTLTGSRRRSIDVAYLDAAGARQGPFRLHFDPRTELVRFAKYVLSVTPPVQFVRNSDRQWLAHFSGLLCYKAALKAVRFSFDGDAHERSLRFKRAQSMEMTGLDDRDESYVEVPKGAQRMSVVLEFIDDTLSDAMELRVTS